MSAGVIGRRYAQALLNLSAREGKIDAVAQGLEELCEILDAAPQLSVMLRAPEVTHERKAELVDELLKRGQAISEVAQFLRFLSHKRRLGLLHGIRDQFRAMADERLGRAQARVTVAFDPPAPQRERLLRLCRKLSGGKQVTLDLRVDPEILGGSVIRIGSRVWDGSLRNDLETIRSAVARN